MNASPDSRIVEAEWESQKFVSNVEPVAHQQHQQTVLPGKLEVATPANRPLAVRPGAPGLTDPCTGR